MRRSASRRSRTLLLKARPPAMGSPPDRDCPPRRPARRTIDPSFGSARGQGTDRAHRGVGLVLVHGGHELEAPREARSEEHTSELQSHSDLVCRLLLEKKKK